MPEEKVKLIRNISLQTANVGDDLLLYDSVNEKFHALNVTAKIAWKLFADTATETPAVKGIIQYFGTNADPKTVKVDVKKVVDKFKKLELVISSRGGKAPKPGEVQIAGSTKAPDYEPPRIKTYTKAWMKENHPTAYLNVAFSDTWGPSDDSAGQTP